MNRAATHLGADLDPAEAGHAMHTLMAELMPLPRSLTGDGVRDTLARIGADVEVRVHEVPTGTELFDWTVPEEWNLRTARVIGPDGAVVLDSAASTLHVVGYSDPVDATLTLAELREHVHTLPEHPAWIPYRTSYWERGWGLCMGHDALAALSEGEYRVQIDARLAPGSLTWGEIVIPGASDEEVLISTPVCHPAMANDNLSGVVLLARLGMELTRARGLRRTHRLLFGPGTLGPLAWLAANRGHLGRVAAGLAVMCVGDRGPFTYKRSRAGDTSIDRAMALVLRDAEVPHEILDFVPWGGDERQFGSPGFALPVGAFSRTPPGAFEENHTSADDLDFVSADALGESLRVVLEALDVLERNRRYTNLRPEGEPQLGRRGLSRRMGGEKGGSWEMALLWNLNMADGATDLLEIAVRSGLPFSEIATAAGALVECGLLAEAGDQ